MDFLKAQIAAKKRKAADAEEEGCGGGAAAAAANGSRYKRRGDEEPKWKEASVERAGEARRVDAQQAAASSSSSRTDVLSPNDDAAASSSPSTALPLANTPKEGEQREVFNVSNDECIRRLRAKGEPIRLFGESDRERRMRLRALELIEERGEGVGQNDFMRALRGAESSSAHELDKASGGGTSKQQDSTSAQRDGEEIKTVSKTGDEVKKREGVGMDSLLDLTLIKRDIAKVYPIIYYTLKGLVRDWEEVLANRPIELRQSNAGKVVAATLGQTKEYLEPLFKQLRHRSVKPDVLSRLGEIVHFVQKREYRNANDAYLQLSIGNAPWPIGVTMVGIHQRSGREKINSSNVAHVLNDEVSRKYIQSLKRLMTFAQTKYPPKDVSMLMG